MSTIVTTSVIAYDLASKLVAEYNGRKQRERDLNKLKEKKKSEEKEDPRRTVTQIDYKKHEDTVKELDRQEKEEVWQRKKEEATQWCTIDHEHGPNCRRPVGGCSHDHQKEWAIYEKSTEEKLKAADRFREEGNAYYRKHNYGLAAVQYRKALLQFDYTFAEGEAEEKAHDAIKVPCLLNLAACKCQQEEWDEVLTQCRLALEIKPRSVKAYYRTGLAHLARDRFEEAKDALMTAYEIEPKNAEVLGALKRLKQNMANYKVRQKEVFKEMLSGHGEHEAVQETPASDAIQAPAVEAPVANGHGAAASAASAAAASAEDDGEGLLAQLPSSVGQARAMGAFSLPNTEREPFGSLASERGEPQAPQATQAPQAPQALGAEGLRARRRGGEEADVCGKFERPSDTAADDDDEDDENLNLAQSKMLNYILFGAAGLAVVSLSVCAVAFLGAAET